MTLEKAGISVESLMQIRDRPLEEAYQLHDLAQDMFVSMMESHGYHCEQHGDDARHADEVLYGSGPDVAVYEGDACVPTDDPVMYTEIKSKEDPEWFGRCNLRHFREYVQFSRDTDVPVFIWFALIDEDDDQLHRSAFIEVEDTGQISEDSVDITDTEVVFDIEDMQQANEELHYVEGSDIVRIHRNDLIVDFLPSIMGNDVVELNSKEFRNLSHVLNRI